MVEINTVQDPNTSNTSVEQTPNKPINFTENVIRNNFNSDNISEMFQYSVRTNTPVEFETLPDFYKRNNVDPKTLNPQVIIQTNNELVKNWNYFKKALAYEDSQHPHVTPESAIAMNRMGMYDYHVVDESKLKPVTVSSSPVYKNYFGGTVQPLSPDQIASKNAMIETKDGMWLPVENVSKHSMNNFKRVEDVNGEGILSGYHWKELGDNEIANSDNIQSIFGDRTFESDNKVIGFGKGLVGGVMQISSGIGELVGNIADLYTMVYLKNWNKLASEGYQVDLEKVYSSIDGMRSTMVNFGNKFQGKNDDENGVYSSGQSFAYSLGNGIGQILPMIVGGGAVFKGASLIPKLAKLAPKLALETSLTIGASEAAAQYSQEMRDVGVDRETAAMWYWPFFAATYASEKLIGPNILEGMWGRNIAKTIPINGIKETFGNIPNNVSNNTKRWFSKQMFKKVILGNEDALIKAEKLGGIKGFIAKGAIGGWEETKEEWSEDIMDYGIQNLFNGYQKIKAENIKDYYNGVTYKDNKDGTYTKLKNGRKEILSSVDYNDEIEEQKFAADVDKGKHLMTPSTNFLEDTAVFWSSFLTSGLVKGNRANHNAQQTARAKLAIALEDGKISEEELNTKIDEEIIKYGIRKDIDINGNIIDYKSKEKVVSQADALKENALQEINYYRSLYKDKGKDFIDRYAGAMNDESLTSNTLIKMKENNDSIEEINALKEDTKTTKTDNSKRIAELEKIISDNEKTILNNITPKGQLSPDNPDYVKDGKTSINYTKNKRKLTYLEEIGSSTVNKMIDAKEEKNGKKYDPQQRIEMLREGVANIMSSLRNTSVIELFDEYKSKHNFIIENHINELKRIAENEGRDLVNSLNVHIANINQSLDILAGMSKDKTPEETKIHSAITQGLLDSISYINEQVKTSNNNLNSDLISEETHKLLQESIIKHKEAFNELEKVVGDKSEILSLDNINLENKPTRQLTKEDLTQKDINEILLNDKENNKYGYVGNYPALYSADGDTKVTIIEDNKGGHVETIEEFIKGLESLLANPEIMSGNTTSIELKIKELLGNENESGLLDNIKLYIKLNLIDQEKFLNNNLEKEHSALLNSPNLRLTKDQADNIIESIEDYKARLINLKEGLSIKGLTEQQYEYVNKTHHIHNQLQIITDIYNSIPLKNLTAEQKELKEILEKAFVEGVTYSYKGKDGKEITETKNIVDIISVMTGKEKLKITNTDIKHLEDTLSIFTKQTTDINEDAYNRELLKVYLNALELNINNIANKLSGKLDNVIKEFIERAKKLDEYNYSLLDDFKGKDSINRKNLDKFGGALGQFLIGQSHFNSGKNTSEQKFYIYSMVTWMNNVNRMGRNGTPTIVDILNGMESYEKTMEGTTEEKMTYEQRIIVQQLVSHHMNPMNYDEKNPDPFLHETYRILNGIILRGYAGAGKSTIILRATIGTIAEINKKKGNKSVNVMIAGTHNKLQKEYTNIIKILQDKYPEIKFITDHIYKDVIDNLALLDNVNIAIMDESSVYSIDEITELQKIKKDNFSYIFLEDDAQISSKGTSILDHPVRVIGERTIPASQIYRTLQTQIYNTVSQFRAQTKTENVNTILVPLETRYCIHPVYGKIGMSYVSGNTSNERIDKVIDNFYAEMESKDSVIDRKGIYLIVRTREDREALISGKLKDYKDNVLFCEYDENDLDHMISGIECYKAYVAIELFNNIDIKENQKEAVTNGRTALTAISRPILYLEMISEEGVSKEVNSPKEIAGLENSIKRIENRDVTNEVLFNKQKAREELTDEIRFVTPKNPDKINIESNINDHPLTISESEELSKNKNINKLKNILAKDYQHVTENIKYPKTSMAPINKIRGQLIRSILDRYFETEGKFTDTDKKIFENLIRELNKAQLEYNIANNKIKTYGIIGINTEDKTIDDIEKLQVDRYLNKILNQFSEELSPYLNNKLFVGNSILSGELNDGTKVQANPRIEIVGITKDGTILVDIIDFPSMFSEKKELTEPDKQKYGYYMNMLPKGFKLNNIKIIPIHTFPSNGHIDINFGDEYILSPEQKIQANSSITDLQKENDYKEVTKEEYFNNIRYVDPSIDDKTNEPVIQINNIYRNQKNNKNISVKGFTKQIINGKVINTVETQDSDGNIEYVSYQEFQDNFKPNYETSKVKEVDYHIQTAIVYDKENWHIGMSIPVSNVSKLIPVNKTIKNYFKLWNIDKDGNKTINNKHLAIMQLLLDGINNNPLIQLEVKSGTFNGYSMNGEVMEQSSFPYAITLEVSKKNILEILSSVNSKTKSGELYNALKDKMTDEQFADMIIENKANILGILSMPEIGFRSDNEMKMPESKIEEILQMDTRDNALKETIKYFDDKFISDFNTTTREQLKKLNISRVMMLFDMKNNNQQYTVRIEQTMSGRSKFSTNIKDRQSFETFENSLNEYGFHVVGEEVILRTQTAPAVFINIQKLGFKQEQVKLFSDEYTSESFAEDIINFKEQLKELKEQLKSGSIEYNRAMQLLENTDLYRLLISNTSTNLFKNRAFKNLFIIKEKTINSKNGKDLKINNIQIKGSDPIAKIDNLLTKILPKVRNYVNGVDHLYKNLIDNNGKIITKNAIVRSQYLSTPSFYFRINNKIEHNSTNSVHNEQIKIEEDDMALDKGITNSESVTFISEDENTDILSHILGNNNFNNLVKREGINSKLFGRLSNGIIYLFGDTNNVEEFSGRHEAVHLIMKHMLSPKAFNSVMDDIIKEMGEAYDGNIRSALEYAAYKLESQEIVKPTNLWQKFILWIRQLATNLLNKFGLYAPSLTAFAKSVREGVYANMDPIYDNSELTVNLDKIKIDEYNDELAQLHIQQVFGNSYNQNKVLYEVLIPKILQNSTLYWRMNYRNPSIKNESWISTGINRTLLNLKNSYKPDKEVTITSLDDKNNPVTITKKLGDMTKEDFETCIAYIEDGPDHIIKSLRGDKIESGNLYSFVQYAFYQMSFQEGENIQKTRRTAYIMLKKMLPEIDIDKFVNNIYVATKIGEGTIGQESMTKNLFSSLSSTLKIILSTIKLTNVDGTEVNKFDKKYASATAIHRILIDTAQLLKSEGKEITFKNMISTMNDIVDNNKKYIGINNTDYQLYINSFLRALGNKGSIVGFNIDMYLSSGIYDVRGQGLYRMVEEKDLILQRLRKNLNLDDNTYWGENTEARDKMEERYKQTEQEVERRVNAANLVFAAIESAYSSVSINDYVTGEIKGKGIIKNNVESFNQVNTIKYNIKNNMLKTNLDESGFVKNIRKGDFFGDKKKYEVDKTGLYIITEKGEKIKIVNVPISILGNEFDNMSKNNFITQRKYMAYYNQIVNYLGVETNLEVTKSVFELTPGTASFGINMWVTMMAMKLNILLEKTGINKDTDQLNGFEIGTEEYQEYKMLETVYTGYGYSMESMSATQNFGESQEEYEQFDLPKPTDAYSFFESFAEAFLYQQGGPVSTMLKNVEGEFQQVVHESNNYNDTIGLGSETYIKQSQNQLNTLIENGKEINSPFVFEGKLVNSPIYNGHMTISKSQIFGGLKNEWTGRKFTSLTRHDIIKYTIESTLSYMLNSGKYLKSIPVINGVEADRNVKNMALISTSGQGNNQRTFVNIEKVWTRKGYQLKSISFNNDDIVNIIDDYVKLYSLLQQRSLTRWNKLLGKSYKTVNELQSNIGNVTLEQVRKLRLNSDYHIKNGKVILGNHTTLSFALNPEMEKFRYNNEFIEQWNNTKDVNEKIDLWWKAFNDDYSAYIDMISDVKYEIPEQLTILDKEVTQKVKDDLFKVILKHYDKSVKFTKNEDGTWTKLQKGSKTILTEEEYNIEQDLNDNITSLDDIHNIGTTNDLFTIMSIMQNNFYQLGKNQIELEGKEAKEVWKEIMPKIEAFKKEYEKILYKEYKNINQIGNPFLKMMFLSFHLYNETLSQLTRGNELSSKNIGDYIKRAAGLTSPGNASNANSKIGAGPIVTYLNIKDIGDSHPLYSLKYDSELNTNGLGFANPIIHELLRRQNGGIDGNIVKGIQKPMIFYYDPITDELRYIKLSIKPISKFEIDNFHLHKTIFKTMLGEKIGKIFENNYNNSRDWDKAVSETADHVSKEYIQQGIEHGMTGFIFHSSAIKLGQENQVVYGTTDGGEVTLDNAELSLTPEQISEYSSKLQMKYYRTQKVLNHDVEDSNRTLLVQMTKLIAIGTNNEDRANELNQILTDFVNIKKNQLQRLKTKEEILDFIKRLGYKSTRNSTQTGILVDQMNNPNISIQVKKNLAIQFLLSDINKALKPTLAGTEQTLTPMLGKVYDNNGKIYLAQDLRARGQKEVINDRFENNRQLKPLSVYRIVNDEINDQTEIVNKNDLLDINNNLIIPINELVIVPSEVICKFPYLKEFGLDNNQTLVDAMEVKGENLYQSGRERELAIKQGKRWTAKRLYDEIIEPKFGEYTYEQILSMLPDNERQRRTILRWGTKGKKIEDNKKQLLLSMAAYYQSLNDSLDLISARIPTGSVSSVIIERIVAFDNTMENGKYVSPKTALLTGHDYDADASQTYFRKIRTYQETELVSNSEKRVLQNRLYNLSYEYFTDPLNLKYLLQETSTSNIVEHAKNIDNSRVIAPNSIANDLSAMEENNTGKEMIGHGATAENGYATIMQLSNKKFIKDKYIALKDDFSIFKAIGASMEIINGATDTVKLGGAIGKLNIVPLTSLYQTGLILKGKDINEIITELKDDDIIKAIKIINSSKNISKNTRIDVDNNQSKIPIYQAFDQILKNPNKEKYDLVEKRNKIMKYKSLSDKKKTERINAINELISSLDIKIMNLSEKKTTSMAGEVIRRIASLSQMQQKIASNEWEFYKARLNIEKLLGMSIKTYLENKDIIKDKGSEEFIQKELFTDDIYDSEIRKELDGAQIVANHPLLNSYIELIDTTHEVLNEGITAYKYMQDETILNMIGQKKWMNETDFVKVSSAFDKIMWGDAISNIGIVNMKYQLRDIDIAENKKSFKKYNEIGEFDLSKSSDRQMLCMLFPSFVGILKTKYNQTNDFINGLNINSSLYQYVQYKNSIYFDEGIKSKKLAAFNKLSLQERQLFSIYQMLFFGNIYRNGTMNELIDNPYLQGISTILDNHNMKITNDIAKLIIIREGIGNMIEKKIPGILNTVTTFIGDKFTYYYDGKGNVVFEYENSWKDINIYNSKENLLSSYPPAPKQLTMGEKVRLSFSEDNENNKPYLLNEVTKMLSGLHGIYKENQEYESNNYRLFENAICELPTGVRVKVTTNGEYTFTVTKDLKNGRSRNDGKKIEDNVTKKDIQEMIDEGIIEESCP